mmetsp:Transcript_65844/g.136255  ORF Transcript_65844/g.136255 Transcript_65844/m.136255 type:complete len:111 (+) Transcript_65844:1612-1944(+)
MLLGQASCLRLRLQLPKDLWLARLAVTGRLPSGRLLHLSHCSRCTQLLARGDLEHSHLLLVILATHVNQQCEMGVAVLSQAFAARYFVAGHHCVGSVGEHSFVPVCLEAT